MRCMDTNSMKNPAPSAFWLSLFLQIALVVSSRNFSACTNQMFSSRLLNYRFGLGTTRFFSPWIRQKQILLEQEVNFNHFSPGTSTSDSIVATTVARRVRLRERAAGLPRCRLYISKKFAINSAQKFAYFYITGNCAWCQNKFDLIHVRTRENVRQTPTRLEHQPGFQASMKCGGVSARGSPNYD